MTTGFQNWMNAFLLLFYLSFLLSPNTITSLSLRIFTPHEVTYTVIISLASTSPLNILILPSQGPYNASLQPENDSRPVRTRPGVLRKSQLYHYEVSPAIDDDANTSSRTYAVTNEALREDRKAGHTNSIGKVTNYLSKCLELDAKDSFVSTGGRVFVSKGVPLMLSRMAPLSPKMLKVSVRMFYIQAGRGLPEYRTQILRTLVVRYFEEWKGLYGRWAPGELDDPVGTPGSAARRYEKRTVAPYRSHKIEEPVDKASQEYLASSADAGVKAQTPRKRERQSGRFAKNPDYRSFSIGEPSRLTVQTANRSAYEAQLSPSRSSKRAKLLTKQSDGLRGKPSFQVIERAMKQLRGKKVSRVLS
ncbi:hypothetical protein EV360DRAFT_86454 [Lentinula raphanica]|nr:hypothetical protein EV360DRAFT_86454 [Lentinula raphanica]